jgi:hypothetical protein
MLGDGRLHLSGIERLAPHLTEENREALLKRAVHRSRKEIEELVAEAAPRPGFAASMRKLPVGGGSGPSETLVASLELRPDAPSATIWSSTIESPSARVAITARRSSVSCAKRTTR